MDKVQTVLLFLICFVAGYILFLILMILFGLFIKFAYESDENVFIIIPIITPHLLVASVLLAALIARGAYSINKKAYQDYASTHQNTSMKPVQMKKIKIRKEIDEIQALAEEALNSLQDGIKKIEKDINSLRINVITKGNKKYWGYDYGETILISLILLDTKEVEVTVTSTSNMWLKYLDFAKNIKNANKIIEYLAQ